MSIKTPVPSGKYAVGTFTYTVSDDRDEVFCPGTKRKTPSRVYYPVFKASVKDLPKLRYMPRNMAKGISRAFKIPTNYDKLEKSGENISECYQNAPRIAGRRFPLVLFSHGAQSYREGNCAKYWNRMSATPNAGSKCWRKCRKGAFRRSYGLPRSCCLSMTLRKTFRRF